MFIHKQSVVCISSVVQVRSPADRSEAPGDLRVARIQGDCSICMWCVLNVSVFSTVLPLGKITVKGVVLPQRSRDTHTHTAMLFPYISFDRTFGAGLQGNQNRRSRSTTFFKCFWRSEMIICKFSGCKRCGAFAGLKPVAKHAELPNPANRLSWSPRPIAFKKPTKPHAVQELTLYPLAVGPQQLYLTS